METVQPKPMQSPISGQIITPKMVTFKSGKKMVTEAHWICPTSGQFIKKGIVKIEDIKED